MEVYQRELLRSLNKISKSLESIDRTLKSQNRNRDTVDSYLNRVMPERSSDGEEENSEIE